MSPAETNVLVLAPREGVNDDVVRVLEWHVTDGAAVTAGTPLALLETTKATFVLEATTAGYVFRLAETASDVPVGAPLAVVSSRSERPRLEAELEAASAGENRDQVVTQKAADLIRAHGLSLAAFAGLPVVRATDVQARVSQAAAAPQHSPAPPFRGSVLDPSADWDAVLRTPQYRDLNELLIALRKRVRAKFQRHVSLGNLLYDRWELAKDYGFGEGTSVYEDCLIEGDVRVGCRSWIGPGTILDGLYATLRIGNSVDVGAGTHIYSHDTIERTLTGRRAHAFYKDTTIGNCCFIAPQSLIGPGVELGDHCFVAAGSYVNTSFPAFSVIAGNPAQRTGTVEVDGARAKLRLYRRQD